MSIIIANYNIRWDRIKEKDIFAKNRVINLEKLIMNEKVEFICKTRLGIIENRRNV